VSRRKHKLNDIYIYIYIYIYCVLFETNINKFKSCKRCGSSRAEIIGGIKLNKTTVLFSTQQPSFKINRGGSYRRSLYAVAFYATVFKVYYTSVSLAIIASRANSGVRERYAKHNSSYSCIIRYIGINNRPLLPTRDS